MREFLIISAVYLTGGFAFFRYWAKYQITKHDVPRELAIMGAAQLSVFWPLFVGGYFLAMIVGTVYGWAVAGLPESRSEREHKIRLLEDEVLRDGYSREDEVKARLLQDAMTQKVIADMSREDKLRAMNGLEPLRCDGCRCPIAPTGDGEYTHILNEWGRMPCRRARYSPPERRADQNPVCAGCGYPIMYASGGGWVHLAKPDGSRVLCKIAIGPRHRRATLE